MKKQRSRFAPAGFGFLGLVAASLMACGGEEGTGPIPPPPVETPRPTSTLITPATVVLMALQDTVRLRAEVRDQKGRPLSGATVTWRSGNTSIATVSESGLVTAASNGTVSVAATSGTLSAEASVTVAQTVSKVVVSPAADTLVVGDTLQLSAEAFDSNDHSVSGVEFAWSSSDSSVIRVDASGLAHGTGDGGAMVTATFGDAEGSSGLTVTSSDRPALVALYEATGGPNWTRNDGWLTYAPLEEWHGVSADSGGRVTGLDLSGNGLVGQLPESLGDLARLTQLRIGSNALLGRLPQSLTGLPLQEFQYADTQLCAPAEDDFQTWLNAIASRGSTGIQCAPAWERDVLMAVHEAMSGSDWSRSDNWLTNAPLEEWYGVWVDVAGYVVDLRLEGNGLTGRIPAELGRLANLERLFLNDNNLSGPIPAELGNLTKLKELTLWHNDLSGPIPPELGSLAALETLSLLYNRLDGPIPTELGNLTNLRLLYLNGNGLTGPIPSELGSLARLEILELSHNQLRGTIPPELGSFASLEWLYLSGNNLSGEIPSELGNLASLRRLFLGGNDLTGPVPAELGSLVNLEELYMSGNRLTGTIPSELANLRALTHLVAWKNELSGPIPPGFGDLVSLEIMSLSDNELTGNIPPELGNLPDMTLVGLNRNVLSGPIPPELGKLANLEQLLLRDNALTGEIPQQLGDVSTIVKLELSGNELSGLIPPEFGNLTELVTLELSGNRLTGPIPPELGNLASADSVFFTDNRLSGGIPAELGNLSGVRYIGLDRNDLTGPIPSELGRLTLLEALLLDNNDLSGPVPAEFAALTGLSELTLAHNTSLMGPLPADLTALGQLEVLLAGGTGLCAPAGPDFQDWLQGVRRRRINTCFEQGPAAAYLTQAVQSRKFPVPLVAGEKALLRVFPTAAHTTSEGIPAVRARFYLDGSEAHVVNIPGTSVPIPSEVYEGSLSRSASAEIPGSVVQPGLEMVIEVDPNGTLDPALEVTRRIPATGRLAVEVGAVPTLEVTAVPFLWNSKPDSLVLDLIGAMASDPQSHPLLGHTRTLLPVGDITLVAHEPVVSSHNNALGLLRETEMIRVLEGEPGYYMGTMTGEFVGIDGLALATPSRTLFAKIDSGDRAEHVIAHELGHNMSLHHPPGCEAGYPDYSYPHASGWTGAWGYDFDDEFGGGTLVPPTTVDLMSYCGAAWISDYNFTNALRHRLTDEGATGGGEPVGAGHRDALLLWGGVAADGAPFMEPAFVVDAMSALPHSPGEYRLSGRTEAGEELFSLSFALPAVADGDGASSFAFVLPVQPALGGDLASVTLTGPGGAVTMDGESDLPAAILRHSQTGQVRGIFRAPAGTATTLAEAVAGLSLEPDLEVLFSPGIPDTETWRPQERE